MTDGQPPGKDNNTALRTGVLAGITAYVFWGMFPLYLKAISSVPALEILSHRILWSVPFAAILLTFRKQWQEVFGALRQSRVMMMLMLAACAIAANWLIYVWAIQQDRILEASLGYYVNPLIFVAAGVFILGERLRPLQTGAITLAAIGVLILTFGIGSFPWVAGALAVSFAAYGYIRKTTNVGALPGLFIEVLLLSPIALFYLIWLISAGKAAFMSGNIQLDGLLILAGPATIFPLVLFAVSARRLTLTTLGIFQYIGPTIQLFVGLYFGETFTIYHGICFSLIWIALAAFTFDAFQHKRQTKQQP